MINSIGDGLFPDYWSAIALAHSPPAELYYSCIVDLQASRSTESCNETNYLFDFRLRFNDLGRLREYTSCTHCTASVCDRQRR
jgi:hypothetical protein